MESLLKFKIILLTFIISTVATKDTRPCDEKILGPLNDNNSVPIFQPCMVDENNTLILRCRVICEENNAYYTPYVRIITTKDGEIHRHTESDLYEVYRSPLDITCNSASPTRDYEFRITVLNDTLFNESIAMCGLFYQSDIERNFTQLCHTSTLAWITLPSRPTPTTMPPPTTAIPTTITSGATTITTQDTTTTMMPPTTTTTTGPNTVAITDSSAPEDTSTDKPVIDAQASTILDGVSIFFIIVAFVCIAVALVIGALFLYKKVAKTPKRKISSVLPSLEDGCTVIQAHAGGVLKCEDIESDSTVKFRTSAQT